MPSSRQKPATDCAEFPKRAMSRRHARASFQNLTNQPSIPPVKRGSESNQPPQASRPGKNGCRARLQSNDSFFVAIVARLTLFDGGRTESKVRQPESRPHELFAREQRMALEIELTVRRANLQASDAREQLEVAKRAVMQAEESLREIEVRYKEQTATITQRIDAQVALSNARVRRSGAQADVEVARRWNRPWVA